MKMKLLFFAIVFCLCASLQAEVFIYKNNIRLLSVGGGGRGVEKVLGWTILDDARNVVQVLVYPGQRRYAIAPMRSIIFDVADGGGGRQYTFFLQHDIWTGGDGSNHVDTGGARGLNQVINVNGEARSIPRVFAWGGRSTYQAPGGGPMSFLESSGTFIYDKARTNASNAEGDNAESAALRLAAYLASRGYSEH